MDAENKSDIRILARQAVLEEITFRMNKLWRIFSWTSTILVAITGGVVSLHMGEDPVERWHQVVIALAAIVIGLYAWLWLRQNLKLESFARDALEAHDKSLGIKSYNDAIGGKLPRPDRRLPKKDKKKEKGEASDPEGKPKNHKNDGGKDTEREPIIAYQGTVILLTLGAVFAALPDLLLDLLQKLYKILMLVQGFLAHIGLSM